MIWIRPVLVKLADAQSSAGKAYPSNSEGYFNGKLKGGAPTPSS